MNTYIKPLQLNKSLVLSSRDMGWNGILVEKYQPMNQPIPEKLSSQIDLVSFMGENIIGARYKPPTGAENRSRKI
jgi:hypothetical protein